MNIDKIYPLIKSNPSFVCDKAECNSSKDEFVVDILLKIKEIDLYFGGVTWDFENKEIRIRLFSGVIHDILVNRYLFDNRIKKDDLINVLKKSAQIIFKKDVKYRLKLLFKEGLLSAPQVFKKAN